VRIAAAVRSEVGRVRRRNEDAYLVQDPVFAVADGMGGHRGGNVASAMSLETLDAADIGRRGVPALVAAIRTANRAVLERGEADRELAGMGTTITAVLIEGDRAHVAHVGDSRAYLLRAGALRQLTEDHTMVQELVRRGRLSPDEAEHHPQRSILTRALGVEQELDVDELTLDLEPGDRLVLCSDGLTGMVTDDAIATTLAGAPDPQAACDRLVEMAIEAGGDDNVTVIVLEAVGADVGDRTDVVDGAGRGGPPVGGRVLPAPVPALDGSDGLAAGPQDTSQQEPTRPRRRRRAVVALLVLVVVLVGAYVGVRAYVGRQWYVGVADGKVAVYHGVPVSFVGFHLSHVDTATDLPATQAEALPLWHGLSDGISARSRSDALAIVDQVRSDLCTTSNAACPAGTVTPTPTPTLTPTVTPSPSQAGASP
jgi:serine/threonine protein phosphatase PrpC